MAMNRNTTVDPDDEDCTAFSVAPIFKLPLIRTPPDLKIALQRHLQEDNNLSQKCLDYIKCIKSLHTVQRLNYDSYLIILKICLYLEQFELDCELSRYKLLNHKIKNSNLNGCFLIDLPYINKETPIVVPDDKVYLTETITKKTICARVLKITENQITIQPEFLKKARIFKDENKRFNINFRSKDYSLKCCHYALMIMSEKHNLEEIIYPKLKINNTDLKDDIKWINTKIEQNEEQKQAIRKILYNTAYPAPYIIFGPPGTGKTATLVELICQIVKHYPMKNILVCATSNAAVDEITKRLIDNVPANKVYRMYAASRSWENIDQTIRPCANFVDRKSLFLPKELLLFKKIIVTTLITSIRLNAINFKENHFSYIIIDEASQAIEPEMLIPLTITHQKNENERPEHFGAQIVIAGDPYQLGPRVRSKWSKHFFGISMLERLMNDCHPYKKQNGKYNPNYITKLIKNYRSHEKLLYVPNKQFYENELKACGIDKHINLNWSKVPNKLFPMIFQEVLGKEERNPNGSVLNTAEILVVIEYVKILLKSKFGKHMITPKDIGIVTPFKQQQIQIVEYLAQNQLENITVGTVETFQGQERTVIIVSTVRSKIFEHDGEEHIGFLSNPKRFNVAVTRAKALMIIIGNSNILCTNKHWKALWEYCKEHNGCIPFNKSPLKSDVIAKLKSDYETNENNNRNTNETKISVTVKLGKNKKRNYPIY
ncbi:putative helicase mov-10-B.1 [Nylanderia fulva]|uniref:putative helicase mov-10-B.1 n=1 Tax=Nylanderia fulva TaxID=613905 RepID=UPI0010FB7EA5|nr:putative helicase mov-10-B.1 [Nylanderia fulva]